MKGSFLSKSFAEKRQLLHAYIPGKTERHPEGILDDLKDGIDTQHLEKSAAWAAGLQFLRDGFFWEAHEVLEAVWMAAPENSAEKLFVQAVIQRANAALKMRMGRPKAATRLQDIADKLFDEAFSRRPDLIMGWTKTQLHHLTEPSNHTVTK